MEQRTRLAKTIQEELQDTDIKLTQRETKEVTDAVLTAIITELKETGSVTLQNYFSLTLKERNSFQTTSIDTGEQITVDGYTAVSFRSSQHLKDLVNQ